jgi:hypothetical protein
MGKSLADGADKPKATLVLQALRGGLPVVARPGADGAGMEVTLVVYVSRPQRE